MARRLQKATSSAPPRPLPALDDLCRFPLMHALLGRRARRFGLGMSIPSGPLAFTSRHAPCPLTPLEQAVLVAAGTGVTGWSFGVPFTPTRPEEHAHHTVRFTGRSAPTAAGIGTPVLFFTDDAGTYLTDTRDLRPSRLREATGVRGDVNRLLALCRAHTITLSPARLEVPRRPPHMDEHNVWAANTPGSTLFMPVGDASEALLGALAILVGAGHLIVDDRARRPAGDLDRFVRTGLLQADKVMPLSVLEQTVHGWLCTELGFMAHNIVLMLQGMGLGGWFYTGLNPSSVLGAFAGEGVGGLGFRFVQDDRWPVPNPVGLDGHYEGACPPYHADMPAAVQAFVERKFGPGGTYDPRLPGPWKDGGAVKATVSRYGDAMVECMAETARYIHDTHGKFPGTIPTMILSGFVQAHHIDTEYYDTHFGPEAYLETHAEHMRHWHDGAR